jgi:predicted DNA-binding transcriptional regulator AlpA
MPKQIDRKAAKAGEIAEIYGISAGTLANLRSKREGPKFYKRGRAVVYFLSDVEAWLRQSPVLTRDSLED